MKPLVLVDVPLPPMISELMASCETGPWSEAKAAGKRVAGLFTYGHPPVGPALLDALPGLKVVSNFAVGFDNIDVAACTRRRIPAGNTPGVLTETTADLAFALLMGLQMALGKLVLTGIGIWGNNVPVGWAFDIINFVWWIGIGHAGTLISAILLLLRQQWRTSINRFAEAMTLFAVVGMWLERYVIVVTSLHRDFLPSSWGMYAGTFWDWTTFIGTMGLFLTLFLLFIRFLPMISIFEMRTLLPEAEADGREHVHAPG